MKKNSGQEFMVRTRYSHISTSPQNEGVIPQPPLELPLPEGKPLIELPGAADILVPSMDLRSAIEARRTVRKYADEVLTLEELAYLLWVSQGVKRVSSRPSTARNVPSAGARHAFETYLLVNRVAGLQPGLYRYVAGEHALLLLDGRDDVKARLTRGCYEQKQVANSAVTFFWVAVLERMYWRYGERGYRYLFLDAGHVCQNLYLAAEAVGAGACAIGAFDDDALNGELGLDGESLFAVYAASLGKRA